MQAILKSSNSIWSFVVIDDDLYWTILVAWSFEQISQNHKHSCVRFPVSNQTAGKHWNVFPANLKSFKMVQSWYRKVCYNIILWNILLDLLFRKFMNVLYETSKDTPGFHLTFKWMHQCRFIVYFSYFYLKHEIVKLDYHHHYRQIVSQVGKHVKLRLNVMHFICNALIVFINQNLISRQMVGNK